ncbi:hypothetical protein BDN72DRAFT_866020, partial [Pluteus cervinus]
MRRPTIPILAHTRLARLQNARYARLQLVQGSTSRVGWPLHTSPQRSPEPTEPEDNTPPALTAAEKRKLTRQKNIKEQEQLEQLNQEDCNKRTRKGKATAKENKVWLTVLSESQQKRREQPSNLEGLVAESSKKRKQSDVVDEMMSGERPTKRNAGKEPSDDEMSIDEGLDAITTAAARAYRAPNLDSDSDIEIYGGLSQTPEVITPIGDLNGDILMGEPDEGTTETIIEEEIEEEPQAEGSGPKDNEDSEEESEVKEDCSNEDDDANDGGGSDNDGGANNDGDSDEDGSNDGDDEDNGDNGGGNNSADEDSEDDDDDSTTEPSDAERSSSSGRDVNEEGEEVENLDNEATSWLGNASEPMNFNNAETAAGMSPPLDTNDEPPASEGEPEPTNVLGNRAQTPPAQSTKSTLGHRRTVSMPAPLMQSASTSEGSSVPRTKSVGDWASPPPAAPPSAQPSQPNTPPPPPTALDAIKEDEWPPEAQIIFDGRKWRSERLSLNKQHPTLHLVVAEAIGQANTMVMLEHPWPIAPPDEIQNTQYCIERAVMEVGDTAQAIDDRSKTGDWDFLLPLQKVILHRNTLARGQVKGFSVNHCGDAFRLKNLSLPLLQAKIQRLIKNNKCTLPYDRNTGKVDKGRPWQNQTLLATVAFVIHKNGNKSLFRRHPELFLQ